MLVFTDSLEVPSVSGSNPAVDSRPARATECNVSIRSEWSAFLKRERMIATAVVDYAVGSESRWSSASAS